jgi:hypothetical protein
MSTSNIPALPRKRSLKTVTPVVKIGTRKYVVIQNVQTFNLLKRAGKVGQFHLYDSATGVLSSKMEWWAALQEYSDNKDVILGVSETVTIVGTSDEEFAELMKGSDSE